MCKMQNVLRVLSVLVGFLFIALGIVNFVQTMQGEWSQNARFIINNFLASFPIYGLYPILSLWIFTKPRQRRTYIWYAVIGAGVLMLVCGFVWMSALMWASIGAVNNGEAGIPLSEQIQMVNTVFWDILSIVIVKASTVIATIVLSIMGAVSARAWISNKETTSKEIQ